MSITIPRMNTASEQSPVAQLNGTIIESIEDHLNALNSGSMRAQVLSGAALEANVHKGDLVYYNTETSKFGKAVAQLEATSGAGGQSVESVRSRVEGMVIEEGASNTGSLLLSGYYESDAIQDCILGSVKAPGTYYLSPFEEYAGKCVPQEDTYGKLQQAVLTYYGGNRFHLNLFYLAHDSHFHGSAMLNTGVASWPACTVSIGTTTYRYKYAANTASGSTLTPVDRYFESMGYITEHTSSLFLNGQLQPIMVEGSTFRIQNGTLYATARPATTAKLTLFNHQPFAYGSPVVREVNVDGDSPITAENVNGEVTLDYVGYGNGGTASSSSAVASLSGSTVMYTPVVSGIIAGSGISVEPGDAGSVVVSSSGVIGNPVDAYGVTHAGTMVTYDGLYQYITFPGSRQADLIISLPVTGVSDNQSLTARCWGISGSDGSSYVSVQMSFVPYSSGNSYADRPSTTVSSGISFAGSSTQFEYEQTAGTLGFSGSGLLIAKITKASSYTNDLRLLRVGFLVNVSGASVQQASQPLTTTYMYTDMTSSVTTYGKVVYVNASGAAALCSSSDSGTINKCLGITVSGAAAAGTVRIATSGVVDLPGGISGATAGSAIYVGTNGNMTATVPTSGYSQRLGTMLSTTRLLINIQQAIAL